MKTITFTEFRRRASSVLSAVEKGEVVVVLRHGKPVAEISPYAAGEARAPSWKRPGLRLSSRGIHLARAILGEREASCDERQLKAAKRVGLRIRRIGIG